MPTDVIFCSICTIVEPLGHCRTPVTEAKCDEECCGEGHAAHEHAGEDVDECTEETAVLPLVKEVGQAVDLCRRDHKHDDAHKNGEITVGLQDIHILIKSFNLNVSSILTLNMDNWTCGIFE